MIYPNRRFWFYDNWEADDEARSRFSPARYGFFKGTDEFGHHTVGLYLGKGRAVCVAYRAGYKGLRKCEDCVTGRKQTLDFYQELYYIQTYHNIEDFDDVYNLDNELWDEALGV